MVEIPYSTFYLLLALAAYGVMVSAVMLIVAVANFIQRLTMRKEVNHLEEEIFLLRKKLTEIHKSPDGETNYFVWSGVDTMPELRVSKG